MGHQHPKQGIPSSMYRIWGLWESSLCNQGLAAVIATVFLALQLMLGDLLCTWDTPMGPQLSTNQLLVDSHVTVHTTHFREVRLSGLLI